jgi:hypothetical protein
MDGNVEPVREVLGELFGLLEALEAKNLAVLEFLKEAGIASDEELAPYLERAGNASSVKWRAARLRMEFLLTPAQKNKEQEKKESEKREKEQAQAAKETDKEKKAETEPKAKEKKADGDGGDADRGGAEKKADAKEEGANWENEKSIAAKEEAVRNDAEKDEKTEGQKKNDSGPEKGQQPQSKTAKQAPA